MNVSQFFSRDLSYYRASDVRNLLKVTEGKKVISFGGGLPDFSLFPLEKAISGLEESLMVNFTSAMQYAPTKGVSKLISTLQDFMNIELSIKIREYDDTIILTGSQQGLDLISRIMIDPGDVIVVEKPSYLAALNSFRPRKPVIYGIEQDENGMKVEELEPLVKKLKENGKKVKFVYTIPTNQNPSGTTMSLDRRKYLYELAIKYDFLIFEDDPYSLLTYEGSIVPSIKSLDQEGRVIYMSTLSKILSPGLRIGWITARKEIIESLELIKQIADLHTSTISQYIAIEWLKRGIYKEFLHQSLPVYKNKRDLMLKELEEYFSRNAFWTKPKGGLFLFMYLDNKINTRELLQVAFKNGVVFVPGSSFFHDGSGENTMRLNFSYPTEKEISNGVRILRESVDEYLKIKK